MPATLCLFAFFATLAARTGSWELGPMRDSAELAPLFWLALFGFGLKAGLFPLHIWLPSAHANAPSHVSAILSGVTIKMGIYGLVRFSGWLPVPPGAGWVVAALGVTSAVLGVAFALGQHDLKRLLAYHSVENIGIILIGLGFALVAVEQGHAAWGRLALAGGSAARVESRPVQGAAVFRRRLGVARHRHARDEPAGRAVAHDAVDGRLVCARCGGDLRAAAAQRLRQRVARLSRPVRCHDLPRPVGLGGHPGGDSARRDRRAGAGVFRQSVRRGLSGRSRARSGGARARMRAGDARRDARFGGACVAIGLAPVAFLAGGRARGGCVAPGWAGAETPAPLVTLGLFTWRWRCSPWRRPGGSGGGCSATG